MHRISVGRDNWTAVVPLSALAAMDEHWLSVESKLGGSANAGHHVRNLRSPLTSAL
jgi:hypothetical protein